MLLRAAGGVWRALGVGGQQQPASTAGADGRSSPREVSGEIADARGGAVARPGRRTAVDDNVERTPLRVPRVADSERRTSPRLRAPTTTAAPAPRLGNATAREDAGDAPEVASKLGNPRTIAKMRLREESRGLPSYPTDAPRGPWASREAAQRDIAAWAADLSTGGFGIVRSGLCHGVGEAGGSGVRDRGVQCDFSCHDHKRGCKWRLTVEQCQEGWAVYKFHPHDSANEHNHTLITTRAEALTRPAMREIPAALVAEGKELYKWGGMGPAAIHRMWKERLGDSVLFNVQDVYHAVGADTGEKRFDATNLVEKLRAREHDQGLFYRAKLDDEGRLTHVFFQMPNSTTIYANGPDSQVVEIDTKVRLQAIARQACLHPCITRPATSTAWHQ